MDFLSRNIIYFITFAAIFLAVSQCAVSVIINDKRVTTKARNVLPLTFMQTTKRNCNELRTRSAKADDATRRTPHAAR